MARRILMPHGMITVEEDEPITRTDVYSAYAFIKKLAEFKVQLPTLMFNGEGKVGFYWDDDVHYVDVDVEPKGVSIFFKDRSKPSETFIECVEVKDLTQEWVTEHMAPFTK